MNVSSSPFPAIRPVSEADVPLILSFVHKLADYEKLMPEVTATEADLREGLFGRHKRAEAVIAWAGDTPVGFAVFLHNFSTYAGRSGIYLEDLFVDVEHRSRGVGKALLSYLEGLARERRCAWLRLAVE
jgi:GNAT superfamily N-acetyltransferase